MMRRRILLCGKGLLACRAVGYLDDLTALLVPDWRLAGLPVAADAGIDTWEPSFRKACAERGVEMVASVATARLGPGDVLFSLQYDRIIRLEELGGARAFNLHFSALPQYRGCFPSVWPLRQGEKRAGVTLHVLTAGIDDGDVVDQRCFDLPGFLTAYDLYRLYHLHGHELLRCNVEAILNGKEKALPQDASRASYYDRKSIDFAQRELRCREMAVGECVNLARSLMFEPYQMPTFEGREVVSCEPVEWRAGREAMPSLPAVMQQNACSAVVRCKDGFVRLCFRSD